MIGGGYDVTHDTKTTYADDTVGNRVYILDALTGNLIWRAGPTADTNAQLQLASMKSAITGDVRSFDLTGDGYDDRMYAADLGGRVWRFDITNGATPANLVQGGVFASVGAGDGYSTVNRKFFYAPDASLVRYNGRSWINIAIGSGDRERPVTDKTTVNRFFSFRDYNIFPPIATNKYLSDCSTETVPCHQTITADDSRLVDVTSTLTPTLASDTAGWYMTLRRPARSRWRSRARSTTRCTSLPTRRARKMAAWSAACPSASASSTSSTRSMRTRYTTTTRLWTARRR